MNKSWMKVLAYHFYHMKNIYKNMPLLILFDIDGTILDMRHMIYNVLKSYDKETRSSYFNTLQINDITVHENEIERLLYTHNFSMKQYNDILAYYWKEYWSKDVIKKAHKPFEGVFEIIHWFLKHENTYIGFNTGRPEYMRDETLFSLNKLGQEYKLYFKNEFLYMNPYGSNTQVENSKQEGVKYFESLGYKVIAFIDNEPENLESVAEIDNKNEILLLHANTIYQTKPTRTLTHLVKGTQYNVQDLDECRTELLNINLLS